MPLKQVSPSEKQKSEDNDCKGLNAVNKSVRIGSSKQLKLNTSYNIFHPPLRAAETTTARPS